MAAQNAPPLATKGRSLLITLVQQASVLERWLRWLALAALMVTILLLCVWRPLYLYFVFPPRLLDPAFLPPRLLASNRFYLPLYPSDFGALATTLLWLLSWTAGRLTGSAGRAAPSLTPAGKLLALQAFTLSILAPLAGLAGLAALSATQAVAPMLSLKIALHLVILLGFVLALRNLRPPVWVVVAPLALLLAAQGVLALIQGQAQSTLIGKLLFRWDVEATANQIGASVIQLADGSRWLRAYGTFPHPNILGGVLCLALPVVAGAALRLPRRSRVGWLLWGAVALGLVALLLCFSRGAWLGVLGAVIWFWLVRRRSAKALSAHTWRLKSRLRAFGHQTRLRGFPIPSWAANHSWGRMAVLALLVLALVGLAAGLGPMLQSRLLLNSVPLEQRSVDERVVLLEASAVFLSQHPLLGVGAGNMPLVELSYPPTSGIAQPVHNVPLAVAVETGLAGLVFWLIPPVSLLWGVWRRKEVAKGWALIGSAALVAVLLSAQLDHYFWSQAIGRLMYWFTIGLCAAFALPGKSWRGEGDLTAGSGHATVETSLHLSRKGEVTEHVSSGSPVA
ncbi:MAG TPA: O-antigen ligase family protein [Ktedonobacterales bacterium]|jgi:hypothetical protein